MSKKRNDIILAAVLLLISVAGFLLYKTFQSSGDYAAVLINGEEKARLPLNKDDKLVINTDGGVNFLVVENGKAYVSEADCPDKICVDHAPISKVGETIVCLPHSVVIVIESDKKSDTELDMVA